MSLRDRPGFPDGLRVLVLAASSAASSDAVAQLKALQYDVRSVSSPEAAEEQLVRSSFDIDVVLVDASLCSGGSCNASLQAALSRPSGPPLVLMHDPECQPCVSVVSKLGAVDVMTRPLSLLKLKTLWQHTVRRMMAAGPLPPAGTKASAPRSTLRAVRSTAPLVTRSQPGDSSQQQQQHSGGGGSGGAVSGEIESGSGTCTSEGHKGGDQDSADFMELSHAELTLGLLGEQSKRGHQVPWTRMNSAQLSGLACGLSHLGVDEQSPPGPSVRPNQDTLRRSASELPAPAAGLERALSTHQLNTGLEGLSQARVSLTGSEHQQTHPRLHYHQQHASCPLSTRPGPKPVLGHPAGRLSDLVVPGQVWGLPTSPLQIVPRTTGSMLPSMPPSMMGSHMAACMGSFPNSMGLFPGMGLPLGCTPPAGMGSMSMPGMQHMGMPGMPGSGGMGSCSPAPPFGSMHPGFMMGYPPGMGGMGSISLPGMQQMGMQQMGMPGMPGMGMPGVSGMPGMGMGMGISMPDASMMGMMSMGMARSSSCLPATGPSPAGSSVPPYMAGMACITAGGGSGGGTGQAVRSPHSARSVRWSSGTPLRPASSPALSQDFMSQEQNARVEDPGGVALAQTYTTEPVHHHPGHSLLEPLIEDPFGPSLGGSFLFQGSGVFGEGLSILCPGQGNSAEQALFSHSEELLGEMDEAAALASALMEATQGGHGLGLVGLPRIDTSNSLDEWFADSSHLHNLLKIPSSLALADMVAASLTTHA